MQQGKPTETDIRRVVMASVIGATIEWYDFFLYGIVAGIVFNKLFFPYGDPFLSTMLAYATFAVGFVARPLGGMIFGHFGDKIGRKTMLVHDADDHGRRDRADRPAADLRADRHRGAASAPAAAHPAGHRPRRRVGRRGADGLRIRAEGEARVSTPACRRSASRSACASRPGVVGAAVEAARGRSSWPGAGASASCCQLRARRRRPLHPPQDHGDARVPASQGPRGRRSACRSSRCLRRYPRNVLLGMGARYIDGVFFNIFAVFSIGYLANTVKVPRTDSPVGGLDRRAS